MKFRLVYVRWFDSALYAEGSFQPTEMTGFCENESAGLLVAEDESSITLALDRCLDTGALRAALCIPKVNVREIRRSKPSA